MVGCFVFLCPFWFPDAPKQTCCLRFQMFLAVSLPKLLSSKSFFFFFFVFSTHVLHLFFVPSSVSVPFQTSICFVFLKISFFFCSCLIVLCLCFFLSKCLCQTLPVSNSSCFGGLGLFLLNCFLLLMHDFRNPSFH